VLGKSPFSGQRREKELAEELIRSQANPKGVYCWLLKPTLSSGQKWTRTRQLGKRSSYFIKGRMCSTYPRVTGKKKLVVDRESGALLRELGPVKEQVHCQGRGRGGALGIRG